MKSCTILPNNESAFLQEPPPPRLGGWGSGTPRHASLPIALLGGVARGGENHRSQGRAFMSDTAAAKGGTGPLSSWQILQT